MEIVHRLQQSIGKGTCSSTGIGTGTSTDTDAQDVDYYLTTDGLVRFRDKIYVSDNKELKKVILREFHVKPYSGHLGYQKMLTVVKKFNYWPNLKKDGANCVARCFDYQHVKVECKHPSGLLQPIVILEWKCRSFPWTLSQGC